MDIIKTVKCSKEFFWKQLFILNSSLVKSVNLKITLQSCFLGTTRVLFGDFEIITFHHFWKMKIQKLIILVYKLWFVFILANKGACCMCYLVSDKCNVLKTSFCDFRKFTLRNYQNFNTIWKKDVIRYL